MNGLQHADLKGFWNGPRLYLEPSANEPARLSLRCAVLPKYPVRPCSRPSAQLSLNQEPIELVCYPPERTGFGALYPFARLEGPISTMETLFPPERFDLYIAVSADFTNSLGPIP
jgi:hypothetical protein